MLPACASISIYGGIFVRRPSYGYSKNVHRYFIMEKSAIQILLRSSLFSYAATAVFLLLLAFGMYRFQWGEKEITSYRSGSTECTDPLLTSSTI